MTIQMIFSQNMKRLRAQRGISQEELAAISGLHRTYISGVERCVRNPTIKAVATIAKALEVEPWELLKPD